MRLTSFLNLHISRMLKETSESSFRLMVDLKVEVGEEGGKLLGMRVQKWAS